MVSVHELTEGNRITGQRSRDQRTLVHRCLVLDSASDLAPLAARMLRRATVRCAHAGCSANPSMLDSDIALSPEDGSG